MRKLWFPITLLAALLLTACGQAAAPAATPTPTLVPLPTTVPATCTVEGSLPPVDPADAARFAPVTDADWVLGPKDAKVTIVEYVSFACGWCIREVPTLKKVLEANPKDVRWVFKHYPMWPKANAAHAAAALALEQKGQEGFWQMHDMIMEGGAKKLNVPDLRGYAEKLGMDLEKFDAVMADSAKVEALAAQDTADAKKYRVTGTPAIFINGRRLSGRRTVENYQAQIDGILKPGGLAKRATAGEAKDPAPAKE